MFCIEDELKIFNKIKNKYKPVAGYHLLLDLDAYKNGTEIVTAYLHGSAEYEHIVNIEYNEKEKEKVIITSNRKNIICYDSKLLRMRFNFDQNQITEFIDLTPSPYKLNRDIKQEVELLIFDLNNPKKPKPSC